MHALLNIVVTGWLLSSSQHLDATTSLISTSGHMFAANVMQQMIQVEEKKILALRKEAGDIELLPPVIAIETVSPEVEVVATIEPEPVTTSITVLASPSPRPTVAAPAVPKPVAPKPTIITKPVATVAPVIRPSVVAVVPTPAPAIVAPAALPAATSSGLAPIPPMVAPPVAYAPPASVVRPTVPAAVVAPAPLASAIAAPAPATTQVAAAPRINGPILAAVNSENIGTYSMSIPKLGLANIPVNPTDARNDAKWKNDLKVGVGQLLCPPGTPNCKTVIFGHSSNFSSVVSNYNEVFKNLIKLVIGDEVTINFQGQTLRYKVTKAEVVGADTASIVTSYGREELVLFTCWPYMSSTNRAVVYLDRQF